MRVPHARPEHARAARSRHCDILSHMTTEKTVYVKSGQGREFKWKSDDAFIKISAEDSGGRFSLVEDNLTTEFRLPRHLHRVHAETFFVVSGAVEFQVGENTVVLR